jgi:hypothetical protein
MLKKIPLFWRNETFMGESELSDLGTGISPSTSLKTNSNIQPNIFSLTSSKTSHLANMGNCAQVLITRLRIFFGMMCENVILE